jgi:hypothetical protein
MTNGNSELPELPAPRCTYADHSYPAFTKQQMIDYARAALSVCADGGNDSDDARDMADFIAEDGLSEQFRIWRECRDTAIAKEKK